MTPAIRAEGLVKTYQGRTPVRALDGLDLEVPAGTLLGLLGPNGAGKTTTVRVLTSLLKVDAGRATVLGRDVTTQPDEVRRTIGLSGQYAAVDETLTGRENLVMVGRLYHLGRKAAQARAAELLDRFTLTGSADRQARTYSGGMRRRLDLAASLVAAPPVLFLDEPTTGLDPSSRINMWEVIGDLVRDGTTVLLTTQYLEEADRLADSIAVVDGGKVIARGTADELKRQTGGERIRLVVRDPRRLPEAAEVLTGLGARPAEYDERSREVAVAVHGGTAVLARALRLLEDAGIALEDAGLSRPTLDDVFLSLTGDGGRRRDGDVAARDDLVPADA
ncbi:ATP-binding cassette domain-containing protein [Streptomyces sp. B21-083]|uniref:ATP-binding cassette domain-containing protein n=1 Tax=Streptomyces sp. B21-083 TaxID=3039410 RepID=UPI002FEFE15C